MEKGGGDGGGVEDPATRAAGGMCDRFLTFLAKNLTMGRMKSIADGGPKNGAGGHPAAREGAEDEDEDEFAIPIERAEFDYEFTGHGDGAHATAATILGESAATTRGVPEPKVPAAADGPVAAEAAAPAVEETKVRRSVTIKEDRPAAEQETGAAPAATVERKRSLFKKRQSSSAGAAAEEQQAGGARVPRRSGLRPRMPPLLRVPTNINERSSTFIEERRKGFGANGKSAPAPDK